MKARLPNYPNYRSIKNKVWIFHNRFVYIGEVERSAPTIRVYPTDESGHIIQLRAKDFPFTPQGYKEAKEYANAIIQQEIDAFIEKWVYIENDYTIHTMTKDKKSGCIYSVRCTEQDLEQYVKDRLNTSGYDMAQVHLQGKVIAQILKTSK